MAVSCRIGLALVYLNQTEWEQKEAEKCIKLSRGDVSRIKSEYNEDIDLKNAKKLDNVKKAMLSSSLLFFRGRFHIAHHTLRKNTDGSLQRLGNSTRKTLKFFYYFLISSVSVLAT